MPATYEPIATTTLGSAASSITFSSIPGTYTDLRFVFVGKMVTGQIESLNIRLNNNTSTLYSQTNVYGTGASAVSDRETTRAEFKPLAGQSLASTHSEIITLDIFSYAGSTNKTTLIEYSGDKNGSGYVSRSVGLFRSTTAVSRIDIYPNANNFAIGTTATLYGILKA